MARPRDRDRRGALDRPTQRIGVAGGNVPTGDAVLDDVGLPLVRVQMTGLPMAMASRMVVTPGLELDVEQGHDDDALRRRRAGGVARRSGCAPRRSPGGRCPSVLSARFDQVLAAAITTLASSWRARLDRGWGSRGARDPAVAHDRLVGGRRQRGPAWKKAVSTMNGATHHPVGREPELAGEPALLPGRVHDHGVDAPAEPDASGTGAASSGPTGCGRSSRGRLPPRRKRPAAPAGKPTCSPSVRMAS